MEPNTVQPASNAPVTVTEQRGSSTTLFTITLSILSFLLGAIVVYYWHLQQEIVQANTVVSAVLPINSTDKIDNKILTARRGDYENLSPEERKVVQQYNAYEKIQAASTSHYTSEELDSYYPLEDLFLKYIDSDKILIGRANVKGVSGLALVSRRDWKDIGGGNSLVSFGGYIESDHYAISVESNGITYYKAGDTTIKRVPNSELPHRETYEKEPAMGGGDYEISFDEPTRTLIANVYKSDQYGNGTGEKLRTVKFILQ